MVKRIIWLILFCILPSSADAEAWFCAFHDDKSGTELQHFVISNGVVKELSVDAIMKEYTKNVKPNDFFGDTYKVITDTKYAIVATNGGDQFDKDQGEIFSTTIIIEKSTGNFWSRSIFIKSAAVDTIKEIRGTCQKAS